MRRGEKRLDDFVEDQPARLVVALALLVLHDTALVIELLLRHRTEKIPHAVAFEPQRAFERGGRDGLEIVGAVEIGGAVVIGGPHFLQVLEIILGGVLAAVEHQMFEQMRETRLALGFVLGTDIVPHCDRDDRRLAVGMDDDIEAILERELLVGDVDLVDERREFGRSGICGACGIVRCGSLGERRGAGAERESKSAGGEKGLELHGTSIG